MGQLVQKNSIGGAQPFHPFPGNQAQATNGQPRPRKRLPPDDAVGQAQLDPQPPHLILKQHAQRLYQLKIHLLGQAAHIVMGLNRLRLWLVCGGAFNHVWINGALRQKVNLAQPFRLSLKDAHKLLANNAPLGLGVGNPLQRFQHLFHGIDRHQAHPLLALERLHYLLRFPLPQQAVVHKDTGQLVANRVMDERRRDRRIDAAAETQQHLPLTHLGTDLLNLLLDEVLHRPVRRAATDVDGKIAQQLVALRRVRHFGVELHRVVMAARIGGCRVGRVCRVRQGAEASRQRLDAVAVAHPDPLLRNIILIRLIPHSCHAMTQPPAAK